MHNQDLFRDYLLTSHVNRRGRVGVSRRAASNCLSRLRRVERELVTDIGVEIADKPKLRALEQAFHLKATSSGMPKDSINDCISALHRYFDFIVYAKRK
jgi:hypothetical protein